MGFKRSRHPFQEIEKKKEKKFPLEQFFDLYAQNKKISGT